MNALFVLCTLMLKLIKKKVSSSPTMIITDFEQAVFNAIAAVYPDSQHIGCQFHYRSAVWKNVGDKGLQSLFYSNMDFQELVYKLYALSYVPTQDLYTVYKEQIVSTIASKLADDDGDDEWLEYREEINSFGSYFLRTWIGKQVMVILY